MLCYIVCLVFQSSIPDIYIVEQTSANRVKHRKYILRHEITDVDGDKEQLAKINEHRRHSFSLAVAFAFGRNSTKSFLVNDSYPVCSTSHYSTERHR